MGKHIVHGDAVGNDDNSSDDNHVSLLVIEPFVCSHPRDNSSWVHLHEVGLLFWLGPEWCVFVVIRSKVVFGLQFDDVPPMAEAPVSHLYAWHE